MLFWAGVDDRPDPKTLIKPLPSSLYDNSKPTPADNVQRDARTPPSLPLAADPAPLPDQSVEDFLWSAACANGEPDATGLDGAGGASSCADPFAEDWADW
jgi:hypothetical protein